MTSSAAIASRAFTLDDQRQFARASGDSNPLHLDARFARRTQMGAPVVHGIHTVLWALEAWLRAGSFDVRSIRVRFHQPLFLDETAEVRIGSRTESSVDLDVIAAGAVIAAIKLSSRPGKISGSSVGSALPAPRVISEPLDPPFAQMADQRGAVAPAASEDEIRRLFPGLSSAIGPAAVGALMATSQVVGMACPGLHSLFAGLDVTRDAASDGTHALGFAVHKTDARFRSLQIDVAGSGLTGRLDAFARPQPPAQADMDKVAMRVAGKPFAGQRALIIGGSRGLGEVAAKIVAAGGGHPVITFREGRQEAERVAGEIRQAGATCDVICYDALRPAAAQLGGAGAVDSCFYFATAKIFQRKSALFEPEKLRVFLDYYVDGFFDLCSALVQANSGGVAMFYPSTTALDAATAGIAEYAMAKAAGETLVQQLNAFMPGVRAISRRLPRIATDQTATVGVASAHDALDVLLPIVHEVQQAARPATQGARG
ncbi:SDR family NAD(P)-dependent oxidoreductase [Bradyrhizobium sp.]|uniref:SDR family NAD(P)-dependent oxidoreductase n=1 Tax=Bradyrhizobium sp. TaxID=376 RepID=UPI001D34B2B5|nr:SDR family NAD(P)-dependent oxidoreductase [Bradyrhizobium sp.]MBI5319932.1 SDR family NAD(P)-dependent oxidoreductase [Bradyrhizobium sp.]